MSVVLETRGLGKRFGGLVATNDVTFQLERGARQALIGPNGAGKTTFIGMVSGLLTPSSGEILFNGEDISARTPQQRTLELRTTANFTGDFILKLEFRAGSAASISSLTTSSAAKLDTE